MPLAEVWSQESGVRVRSQGQGSGRRRYLVGELSQAAIKLSRFGESVALLLKQIGSWVVKPWQG